VASSNGFISVSIEQLNEITKSLPSGENNKRMKYANAREAHADIENLPGEPTTYKEQIAFEAGFLATRLYA